MANGQGFSPFGDIPERLQGIVQQRSDPNQGLINARLAEANDEQQRQQLLSRFFANTDLSTIKPSDILGVVTAITGNIQLVGQFASARLAESAAETKKSLFETQQESLKDLAAFQLERAEGGIDPGESAEILSKRTELGIGREFGVSPGAIQKPKDRFIEPTVAFSDRFTLESIDRFNQTQKFSDLVERPEFLDKLIKQGEKTQARDPAVPTEKQRKRLIKEARKAIEKDKNLDDLLDIGITDVTGISIEKLARGEDEETRKKLSKLPAESLLRLDRFARLQFDISFIEKMRAREQEAPSIPTLPSEIASQVDGSLPEEPVSEVQRIINEGAGGDKDNFGFSVGETRKIGDRTFKYTGNNQWVLAQ